MTIDKSAWYARIVALAIGDRLAADAAGRIMAAEWSRRNPSTDDVAIVNNFWRCRAGCADGDANIIRNTLRTGEIAS